MLMITRIGVIDASKNLHRDFAIQAIESQLEIERHLAYEFYFDENYDLAEHHLRKVDTLITEIMQLKTHQVTQNA